MRNRRTWLSGAAAVGMSCLLMACGSSESDSTTEAKSATGSSGNSEIPAKVFDGVEGGTLNVYATTGGQVSKAKENSIYKAFTEGSGMRIKEDFTNSDTVKFFAAMEAGQAPWDIVELANPADWTRAVDKGYLAKLDPSVVPLDKLEPGNSDDYGFRFERFGFMLAWNTDKWPKSGKHPEDMVDLYNTKDFPGKRCMFNYPQYGATLESALLADGVSRDELYPLDVPRALKKLDTIKKDIVWWGSGDEAQRFFETGECDIGVIWSGRLYDAAVKNGKPLAGTWKNALYTDTVFGIPKTAKNPKAAQAFLATWILDKQGQRDFVKQIPYPTPIKGLTYDDEITQWMPIGENLEMAIQEDDLDYYPKNIDELTKTFTKWLGS